MSAIADQAAKLLCILRIVDLGANLDLMRVWRDNLRKWVVAVILKPLNQLLDHSQQRLVEAAAAGLPSATTQLQSNSLFGPPKPVTATPALGVSRPNVTVAQWIQHAHSDVKAQARLLVTSNASRVCTIPHCTAANV